ncbi:DNA polymerase III subunit chi [Rhodalgimonas zhirmunskyi]|uniref:DNA polymerase III subunit chi n=1 Tax=Rhodalgimonas zhirmunskyi TaxID=2964767 RepID=A0AAJ1X481_9RHOB|nr:DNA polymerase III subunit chi [Rhodoalgimonas zhirmunskyi]MDQ2093216.1 DNA polymerase III subunit chi [Rhodoalgimonas zhirmunskyi]
MGEVFFYHLTRRPLEAVLPDLLVRSIGRGWKVAVRGVDEKRMDWLDQKLWQGPEDGFLPHGLAGGAHDARQPVLLTTGRELPNAPDCLMSVDGAELSAEEVKTLDRTCVLFDGNDQLSLATARGQWKALVDAGCAAKYWSEESGRWEMKAEAGGA